ncbi:Uma2 family endonuclease [Sphingomonas bacterium]|uniref:Uma2 family endonuclease n=1 Tax=Sphingomonas bacterium TaxID=1895847 RepID=UPI001C2CD478|nr:Uma2 family endonuclease [Sphingomonas bacterium]
MNAPARILTMPERLRLRVEDFVLLADSGAFDAYAKSELIDGEVYVMNAQWSRHARVKSRLARELGNVLEAIGGELEALIEVSVRASDHDMPEPDIALTSWRGDRDVPVATVALVVEVADTTLEGDLGRKLRLYAAAGVPEYWVVDVNDGRILVHHQPGAESYGSRRAVAFGERLVAVTVAGLAIDTGVLAL